MITEKRTWAWAFLYPNCRMSRIVHQRQMQPLLQIEWLFRLLPIGSEQKRCLSILHNFTDQVIDLVPGNQN